jgi:hypothetical protein
MWRYAIALSVLTVLLVPNLARAQFQQGDYELTLLGSGANDKDFRTGAFTVSGSLGYFVTDQIEVGLRQGFSWLDGGSSWGGATRIAADYHLDFGRWQPFGGVNVGYQYGEDVTDAWMAGPEVGVKYFVNATTFVQAIVSYDFELCHGLDTGGYIYGLGIGFKF